MENYRKKYYIKNIEKFREYYHDNIEKFREYYHDNKDSIAAYEKLYYQQNKVQIRERQRAYFHEYYQLNKEKIQENSYRRYYDGYNLPHKRNYLDVIGQGIYKQGSLLDQNIIIRLTDD